jgi:hypothetical protein
MDILDQEATEDESLLSRQPHLAQSRQPSHIANQSLIGMANQYESTIKMASASDATVRTKWAEWKSRIEILAGGEVPPFLIKFETKLNKTGLPKRSYPLYNLFLNLLFPPTIRPTPPILP